jgi:hypothetical protein
MVVFLCALLVIAALTLSPKPLTEGQHQKEEEMIWRGNQYKRGIKLYYRKTGRFPQSLDDLTKPKLGTLRFMRKAYADPMNPDGSWRLIYVGPSGQLIGSLTAPAQNLLLPGGSQNPAAGQNPGLGQNFGVGGNPAAGAQNATGTAGAATADAGSSGGAQQGGTPAAGCGQQATASDQSSGTTIVGGNIIGLGSKVDRPSLKVLNRQTNYCKWEFIWDPTKDALTVGQPGVQVGTPISAPVGNAPMPPPTSGMPGLPGGTQQGPNPQQNAQF